MAITDDLRAAINASGKSATALAKETGISQPTISRFIGGADIKFSVAAKLAEHFGLDLQPKTLTGRVPFGKRSSGKK